MFWTHSCATREFFNRAAGMRAVSSVLLTTVVARVITLPLANHFTTLDVRALLTKLFPLTVIVMSTAPARALSGVTEVIDGSSGLGAVTTGRLPQPAAIVNAVIAIVIRVVMRIGPPSSLPPQRELGVRNTSLGMSRRYRGG
jgi:hypothetical protein